MYSITQAKQHTPDVLISGSKFDDPTKYAYAEDEKNPPVMKVCHTFALHKICAVLI